MDTKRNVVVALTGASGATYAVELIRSLKRYNDVATHLIISPVAEQILVYETGISPEELKITANFSYSIDNLSAPIASGSYYFESMVIIPCTMKTAAAVSNGLADNLITRTADVALKEKRRLVLVTRETPLSLIHLNNMVSLTKAGAVIMPASPGFYSKQTSLEHVVEQFICRVLAVLGFRDERLLIWRGGIE